MKHTPETLLQIFMGGSLTPEAQVDFDRLMKESPEFVEKVTNAMAANLGPMPESSVESISDRLDAKFESMWVKNKPSRAARYFRIASKIGLALGIVGVLGYLFSILWPRLVAILPQVNLSATGNPTISQPKSVIAPPAIIAPESLRPSLPALVQPNIPVKAVVAPPAVAPTVPAAPKPNFNVQTGNSIRLVVDNDKSQNVNVTVLDPSGVLVRHLYHGHWDPGSHFVDWDGKSDTGLSVNPGNYTVVVKTDTKTQSGTVVIQANH
jgi:hypothetical protein